jgi:hypothetical protein
MKNEFFSLDDKRENPVIQSDTLISDTTKIEKE